MPYYRKKRVYRKKRPMRRNRRKYSRLPRRSLGNPNQKVYYFKRFTTLGTIVVTSSSANAYGASVFSLDQLPGYTEFTNLFDFYKIKAIKLSFIPTSNVTLQTGNSSTTVANSIYNNRIFTVIDYNDAGIPTSVNELREYSNCKWSPNNKIHKRYIVPNPLADATDDSTISLMNKPWVPSTNYAMDYYAIKWAIENTAAGVGVELYKMEAKFYIACKSPK